MLSGLDEYKLVILSNYFEEPQRNRLKCMGINDCFSAYYGEKSIKPYMLSYIKARGKYKSSECVIVGSDKYMDVDVPKIYDFNTIFINEKGDIKAAEELSPEVIRKILKKEN